MPAKERLLRVFSDGHDGLPAEAVTQTFAILAKRRVGKTYTASVMAEEFVAARLPFIALDPTGAWWGLRASADGKGPGLPVVVIGGKHGDLPLEPESGKLIADLVVDHPGYYILDLSLTKSNAEQDRFATDFAERLYRRKQQERSPLHLFVDECDAFIPQRPYRGQERMLGAVEDLVRRGRARGIGVTLVTQRSAVLNKDVLTQIEVLVVLRTISPQDRKALDEWIAARDRHDAAHGRPGVCPDVSSRGVGRGGAWAARVAARRSMGDQRRHREVASLADGPGACQLPQADAPQRAVFRS